MKTQLSHSFILPMMKFVPLIANSINSTYIGHSRYEGQDIWGNYLYVEIKTYKLNEDLLKALREHSQYSDEIDELESVLFIFRFNPQQKRDVVIPFTEGKYSEISRDYVREHFPMHSKSGVSMNWRILNKDIWQIPHGTMPLREYWHKRIGQPIPQDAEVWSRPQKEFEVYNYYDEIIRQEMAQVISN